MVHPLAIDPPEDPEYIICRACNPEMEWYRDEDGDQVHGLIDEGDYLRGLKIVKARGYSDAHYEHHPVCLDHLDEYYPPGGYKDESVDPVDPFCVICGKDTTAPVTESVRSMSKSLLKYYEDREPEASDDAPAAGDGIVFYKGPSELDGKPIVAIATGIRRDSANVKTGPMVQTWILRQDENPVAAVKSGADASVCGSCIHRLIGRSRTCYVNVGQAPNAVYKGWQRGIYPDLSDFDASTIKKPKPLRRGSYGDPAAVPAEAWNALQAVVHPKGSMGGTGYTHQWKTADPNLAKSAMASVDSPEERAQAKAKGYRTFRVRKQSEPLDPNEIACPASEEGGHRTTCDKCKLCSGAGPTKPKKDIAIIGHGAVAQKKYHDQPKIRPPASTHESTSSMARRLFDEGHRMSR